MDQQTRRMAWQVYLTLWQGQSSRHVRRCTIGTGPIPRRSEALALEQKIHFHGNGWSRLLGRMWLFPSQEVDRNWLFESFLTDSGQVPQAETKSQKQGFPREWMVGAVRNNYGTGAGPALVVVRDWCAL